MGSPILVNSPVDTITAENISDSRYYHVSTLANIPSFDHKRCDAIPRLPLRYLESERVFTTLSVSTTIIYAIAPFSSRFLCALPLPSSAMSNLDTGPDNSDLEHQQLAPHLGEHNYSYDIDRVVVPHREILAPQVSNVTPIFTFLDEFNTLASPGQALEMGQGFLTGDGLATGQQLGIIQDPVTRLSQLNLLQTDLNHLVSTVTTPPPILVDVSRSSPIFHDILTIC